MRKIALEEHWQHPLNADIIKKYTERTPSAAFYNPDWMEPRRQMNRTEGIEKYRLKEMEEAGVDIQIVSLGYPGISGIIDANEAVSSSIVFNDALAEITRKYPEKLKGFAALPLQDPKAAADELERTVKDFGFLGALINGHTNGAYLDADKFRIVWERAVALGVPLYLHAFDPLPDQIKVYDGYPALFGPAWSWNSETATHVMRIIYSGLFEDLPDATLIIGHMGEGLPFLLGRIDEGYKQAGGAKTWKIGREPSYYFRKNVMVTTSGEWNPEALTCTISAVGADHVMFSIDFPHVHSQAAIDQVESAPISQEIKEKIFYKNAERLFGL